MSVWGCKAVQNSIGKRVWQTESWKGAMTLRHGFVGRPNEFSVQRFVTLRGRIPGKIARHRAFHESGPELPIPEHLSSAFHRVPEGFARIFVTEKTVAAIRCRIVILDDFLDSARHTRHRNGPILQVIHGAKTGWLETRWNQTDVHACLNKVRQFFVVTFLVGKPGWKFSGRDAESGLICGIAFSENDQTHIIPEKSIEEGHEDFEPFFLNDASHHPEDRTPWRALKFHFL